MTHDGCFLLQLLAINATFANNSAPSSFGRGGAVLVSGGRDVAPTDAVIRGCAFSGNTAGLVGGAVTFSNARTVSIDTTRFERNSAAASGGAVYVTADEYMCSASLIMERATLTRNVAAADALTAQGSDAGAGGSGQCASSGTTATTAAMGAAAGGAGLDAACSGSSGGAGQASSAGRGGGLDVVGRVSALVVGSSFEGNGAALGPALASTQACPLDAWQAASGAALQPPVSERE